MTESRDRDRPGRRALALYATYVLLTTAVAVLLVQLGVRGMGRSDGPVAGLPHADGEIDLRVRGTRTPDPVRTPSPRPSPSLSRSARPSPSSARPTSARPSPSSARPTTRPPTTRPPTTRPPASPTPTTAAPRALRLYLDSGGRRTSTPTLPMTTAAPGGGAVPNYDTDRNPDPGLTVVKGGSGATESNARQVQAWSYAVPTATRVRGSARVTFHSALAGFRASGRGVVTVHLQHCAPTCVTLGSATVERTSWAGGSRTWLGDTAALGSVDRTLPAGSRLRVVIVVGKGASGDMWFAYDTSGTPAALRIG